MNETYNNCGEDHEEDEYLLQKFLQKNTKIDGRCSYCNSYTVVHLVTTIPEGMGKLICEDCHSFGQPQVNGPFANVNLLPFRWADNVN